MSETRIHLALDRLRYDVPWIKYPHDCTAETQKAECLGLAVNAVWCDSYGSSLSTDEGAQEDYSALASVISEQYPDRIQPDWYIPAFNDHPDTTFEDIERVCEKAYIKRQEEVGSP